MSEQPEAARPDHVKVTYRRMKFDFEDGFPRYWHSGSPFITFFWDSLSQSFPEGERFFIDSIKRVRDQITDPALLEEMDNFVAQEAHHTAQHQRFNKMVEAQGFDMGRIERRYSESLMGAREELVAEPMRMLAITMALEHFTAGFAEQYLTNPNIGRGADEKVRALWAWHAAEEAEHKATAFDVYQKLHGSYGTRVRELAPTWISLVAFTLVNTFDMLKQDGKLGDHKDIAKGMWYLLGRKGLVSGMLPAMFKYYRGGFHPWRRDDSALIEQWTEKYGHYIEQLGLKTKPGDVASAN